MANRLGRYRALYNTMLRPDNASVIPRHVFVRSANSSATPNKHSKGDRIDCFESTFVHLSERYHGKEVFLIGSSNMSTMLA